MRVVYAPQVKVNSGEILGFSKLQPAVKDSIEPIFELVPKKVSQKTGESVSDAVHAKTQAQRIAKCWDNGVPCHVDLGFSYLESESWIPFMRELRNTGVNWSPVVPFQPGARLEPGMLEAVKSRQRITFRCSATDAIFNPDELHQSAENLKKDADRATLIVDVGVVESANYGALAEGLIQSCDRLSSVFRRVVIACRAFPERISDFEKDEISEVHRSCYRLWKYVQAKCHRPLSFSDSLTTGPHPDPKAQPRPPIPNIRYTGELSWFVIKGHDTKETFEQYVEICLKILAMPCYRTWEFSWGDKVINDIATRQTRVAKNLPRALEACAHATFVVSQLERQRVAAAK